MQQQDKLTLELNNESAHVNGSLSVQSSTLKDTFAGVLGGIACLYTGHPFDTAKVRLQVDDSGKYKGPLNCMIRMTREEGFRSLFQGATPSLVSMMLENGILFLAYGRIKESIVQARSFFGQQHTQKFGKDEDQLTLLELGLAGSLSSFFSSFALCPTELIKCRLQAEPTKYKGPIDCTVRTIQSDGFKGLFRGLTGTLYREMPGNFAFFGAYETARYLLTPKGQSVSELGPVGLMTAGGLGGVAFWALVYPFDTVKTHLQTEANAPTKKYRSFFGTMRHLAQTHGVASLYRGIAVTLWRAFPSNAALFLTYELTRKYM